jgi:hypothetical protein
MASKKQNNMNEKILHIIKYLLVKNFLNSELLDLNILSSIFKINGWGNNNKRNN